MADWYKIGLSWDDLPESVRAIKTNLEERVRLRAAEGAKAAVVAEVPNIRSQVHDEARSAVLPYVGLAVGLGGLALVLALRK